jgi:hypothetical protein
MELDTKTVRVMNEPISYGVNKIFSSTYVDVASYMNYFIVNSSLYMF